MNDQLNEKRNAELRKQFAPRPSTPHNVGFIAGAGILDAPDGFRAPVAGDPDVCLKLLKTMQPRGLKKGTAIDNDDVDPDSPTAVVDLIKRAHETKLDLETLDLGYSGREIRRAAEASVAETHSPELRKAVGQFEAMTRKQLNRRPV